MQLWHQFLATGIAVAVGGILLVGAGCGSKAPQSPTGPTTGTPPTTPTPPSGPAPPGPAVHSTLRAAGERFDFEFVWSETLGNGQRFVYDDFTLASTTTLRHVEWQGIRDVTSPPVQIYIGIIADSNMPPRQLDAQFLRPAALWSTIVPFDQVNERLDIAYECAPPPQRMCGNYDYSVTMPTPFVASAGTRFWLMIAAESPPRYALNTGWGWRKGTVDNGFARSSLAGTTHPWDQAFALRP